MSQGQYSAIAAEILSAEGCRVLVIGAGNDSELWFQCSRGSMLLVENDPKWIPDFPCEVLSPNYRGKVETWLETVHVPEPIRRIWDFVIVDGPTGFSPECIGRQEPIAWAAQFGKTVFVHDYERAWERRLCDHYLGKPSEIISFERRCRLRALAVYRRNEIPG